MLAGRGFQTIAAEIETFLGRLLFVRADDGGEKNAVTPNDRRRPARARNIGFPSDVLSGAPGIRQVRVFNDPARLRPAKLRPSIERGSAQRNADKQRYKKIPHREVIP